MNSGTGTCTPPGSLKELIARVNRIRKENPALQSNSNLRFHGTDNPSLALLQQGDQTISRTSSWSS